MERRRIKIYIVTDIKEGYYVELATIMLPEEDISKSPTNKIAEKLIEEYQKNYTMICVVSPFEVGFVNVYKKGKRMTSKKAIELCSKIAKREETY